MTSAIQAFASLNRSQQKSAAINEFSLETIARPRAVNETLASQLASGTSVYITALPGIRPDDVVAASVRLRAAGLNPVPHLGARHFESGDALERLLENLTSKADVDQVLLIGGNIDRANGPYASALDVLRAGVLVRHGIQRVGLAAYPEGHPRISNDRLGAALAMKIIEARALGLHVHIVTQFCFSAAPIRAWLALFSAQFPEVPVHVGLAGPAAITTLLKFAATCGIGASMRALRRNVGMGRVFTETNPSAIIWDLMRDDAVGLRVDRFHFFTFGGIRRTSDYVRTLASTEM